MLKTKTLDTLISQYYDEEMSENELINYEARIAISKSIRDYTNERCFEYFKISNSIKLVKKRADEKSKNLINKIDIKRKRSLFFYFNPVVLKRINKTLCNLFLNIWRDNP